MTASTPRLLDAFCCEGGAGRGYADAGFDVVGIDINPQPRYPFEFVQGDAIAYIREHGHEFDVIHTSPPCQHDSVCQRIQGNRHPDLIGPTRDALINTGRLYVIENVVGARKKLRAPMPLCGLMFGMHTDRHRLFEANVMLLSPPHPDCKSLPKTKMGRRPEPGHLRQYVGNFSGVAAAREDMGMPWASRDGLRESIPPAYTRFIGEQLMDHLQESAA